MSQIIEKLWLGSKHDAINKDFLDDIGISHVLSVTELDPPFPKVRIVIVTLK